MTDEEINKVLDESYDDLLVVLNTQVGARMFHNAVHTDLKLRELERHWWVKLGKKLHVL